MKGKGTRILVVDDDRQLRYLTSRLLQDAGYAVLEAATGTEGLELARTQKPDLILLDVMLPDVNGLEVCRRIKAESDLEDSLVVLASHQRIASHEQSEGLEVGADGYIVRPIPTRQLLAQIEALLRTRAVEDRYREVSLLLETIFENTPILVAYLDPDFNFIRVNRAYAEADGRAPSFFPGKNHFELYPDPTNEEIFRRVVEAGEPFLVYGRPFEYEKQPERGVSYWDWSLIPIKSANGTTTGLVLTLANVTERTQAEQALKRERDFTSVVLDTAGALVVVLNPQGRIVQFNRACETLTGYTFEEVEGERFWDLFLVPEEMEPVQKVFEELKAGEFPNTFENFWVTRGGQRRLIAWSNTALLDGSGSVDYIIGTGIDVTEQRKAEQALRESERQYRRLVEMAQEGVWSIDGEDVTTFVNPRMAEMLGYTIQEMVGKHLFAFMDEQGIEISKRNLERRRQGIKEQHDFEFLRKDGSRIYTSLETSPITDDTGSYVGALALVADITERKRAEDALATLLEISQQVALTTEVGPLLTMILDQIKKVVEYDHGIIWKADEGSLSVLAYKGTATAQESSSWRCSLKEAHIAQQVMAERKAMIIPDLQADGPFLHGVWGRRHKGPTTSLPAARSWLGVPIAVKDQVMGLLTLQHGEPNRFEQKQVDLIIAFGHQVAVALENARLFERTQALAAAEERQRLARDLHDAVSQTLFSASLAADVLPRLWETRREEGQRCLEELQLLTRSALAEMRTLLLELRPAALAEVDLPDLVQQLVEAASGRSRLPITLTAGKVDPLPPEVHVTFYRIAQEALSNIVKHAAASGAWVSLQSIPESTGDRPGGVELCVEDDGRGFCLGVIPPDSMGLSIMQERAAAIGATLQIESQVGQGTRVTVIWPANDA